MKISSLALVLAASACGSDAIMPCTLLGCEGGLTVHLASRPSTPFRVEIAVRGGDQILYVYDCTGSGRCAQDIFFPGLTADAVTITVRVATTSRSTAVSPAYTSFRPNGPNCPPDCRGATVTADVPA